MGRSSTRNLENVLCGQHSIFHISEFDYLSPLWQLLVIVLPYHTALSYDLDYNGHLLSVLKWRKMKLEVI